MGKLQEGFDRYHKKYPEVYELFDQIAKGYVKEGKTRHSAHEIILEIKWKWHPVDKDGKLIPINHTYSAYYSRLWRKKNPDIRSLFRISKVEADYEAEIAANKAEQGRMVPRKLVLNKKSKI